MKQFPWGLLTLALVALDLAWSVLYLLRKRLARLICQRALARGKRDEVSRFIMRAQSERLIKATEAAAWRKMFGLEEECKPPL
jgi:hypothetical protein